MAFTYTDSAKIVLEALEKFKVTLLEAVETGDLMSWYNTDNAYTVQFADQSDSQRAGCIAMEKGAAGDEIWACQKAVLKTISTIGTGGVVTRVYFAGASDFFGAPLYLGESGKPSSTPGTTFTQEIGKLLARDQILIDLAPAPIDVTTVSISGATALNARSLVVTDACTNAGGYARALYISATASGTKTASGEHNTLGIDLTVTGDTPYAYIQSVYLVTSGNPTIGLAAALSIYIDDLGTACAQLHMLDLMYGSTNAPTGRNAYMRIRNHSDNTPTSVIYLQANNNAKAATNFIEEDSGTVGPVAVAVNVGTDYTPTFKIRCLHGSTTFYLTGVAEA